MRLELFIFEKKDPASWLRPFMTRLEYNTFSFLDKILILIDGLHHILLQLVNLNFILNAKCFGSVPVGPSVRG